MPRASTVIAERIKNCKSLTAPALVSLKALCAKKYKVDKQCLRIGTELLLCCNLFFFLLVTNRCYPAKSVDSSFIQVSPLDDDMMDNRIS
jgi:hypothetical protein